MRSTTASATIRQLAVWFSRLGLPVQLHSDCGPQLACREFREAMSRWGVVPTLSPPYSSPSNGAAERAVRQVKTWLMRLGPERLDACLFRYRATPLEGGSSPAELLMGRALRSRLSVDKPPAAPRDQPEHPRTGRRRSRGGKMTAGKNVVFRNPGSKEWVRGSIVALVGRSVVYIRNEGGDGVIRRHLNDVRLVS